MKNYNCLKIFCLLFVFILIIPLLTGCIGDDNKIQGTPDVNINMTPRKITAESLSNFEDVVNTVAPAVVGISANYGNMESVGSGVCISEEGYILTNNHVVEGANSITVYFANKTSGNALLVWNDPSMDLAVIKAAIDMPYLETANSDEIKAGEDVIAIGTPLTLQFKHTVTKGIVSAINRTMEISNEDGTISYLQNLIQHDASINPGNSGGPLINNNGKVIGINTLKVSEAEGIGFAIPVEIAIPVLEHILNDGEYQTPYLGIFGLDSEIAVFYGRSLEKNGVYIVNIDNKGPIAKANLQVGDIITKVNGVEVKTMLDLKSEIYKYKVGESIKITYNRNGEIKNTKITLVER